MAGESWVAWDIADARRMRGEHTVRSGRAGALKSPRTRCGIRALFPRGSTRHLPRRGRGEPATRHDTFTVVTFPIATEDAMDIDMKKYAKLASLGALAVAAGCVGLYGLLAWVSTPSPTGGIDGVHATIAYIGIAIPIGAIIAVHVTYARVLANYAKDNA
jgi:hypothetical protein